MIVYLIASEFADLFPVIGDIGTAAFVKLNLMMTLSVTVAVCGRLTLLNGFGARSGRSYIVRCSGHRLLSGHTRQTLCGVRSVPSLGVLWLSSAAAVRFFRHRPALFVLAFLIGCRSAVLSPSGTIW